MDRNKKVDLTDYASMQIKLNRVRFPYKTMKDKNITDKLIHQLSGVRSKLTRGGKISYDGSTKHDDYYVAFILLLKQCFDGFTKPMKVLGFKKDKL